MNESIPRTDTPAPSDPKRSSFLDDLFTRNNGEVDQVGERRFIAALEERQQRWRQY